MATQFPTPPPHPRSRTDSRKPSGGGEEGRLDDALRRADALLLESLKSEDQARRKRRRLIGFALLGGIPVITAALWITLALTNASVVPTAAPQVDLSDTSIAANAPAARAPLPATSPPPPAAPAAATAPGEAAIPAYKAGDAVQIKWGGMWFDGKIVQRESDIYLVSYDSRAASQTEWVTFDRIRTRGSAREIDYARPTPRGQKPDAAARAAALANYQRSIGAAGNPGRSNRPGANDQTAVANPGDLSAAAAPELINSWEYKPDALAAGALRPGPFTLDASSGAVFEKADALFFSTGAPTKAAVSVLDATPGKPAQAKVDVIDLAAGRRVRTYTLPPETRPLAISPDGSRMAVVTHKFGFGNNTQVDILTLGADGKMPSVASFAPYAAEEGPARDVAWAAMPDNDHVLTFSGRSTLTLWKAAEAKAIWSLKGALASSAVVSPGGKYVLADTDQRTVVIDILSGKGAGKLPGELGTHGSRVFRPDGAQLASIGNGRVQVVDLAANQVVHDIHLPPAVRATEAAWAGDKSLLLEKRYLLDLEKGIITWDYQTDGVVLTRGLGDRLWYVTLPAARSRNVNPTLSSAVLPHPAAVAAAKAIDDKAYAIRPGTQVTLEVNTSGHGDAAKVTEALTRRLAENQMSVTANQPVKLVATITPGKTREISYRMFGSPGNRSVTVTDLEVKLKFVVQDQVAWETGSVSSAPAFIQVKEGQTTQQAVEEQQANAWKFFESVHLPKRMPAPKEPLGYGKSALNASR